MSDAVNNVPGIDLSPRSLGKHWRKQEKVILVNQNDATTVRIRKESGQFGGYGQPAKTGANDNQGFSVRPCLSPATVRDVLRDFQPR